MVDFHFWKSSNGIIGIKLPLAQNSQKTYKIYEITIQDTTHKAIEDSVPERRETKQQSGKTVSMSWQREKESL